jgi:cysteine synthase
MALQRAAHLPPGSRIVTTICDSGLKYLRGDLYQLDS